MVTEPRILPTVRMQLFTPGKTVEYEGQRHTVDHVVLNSRGLFVVLKDVLKPVPADRVWCEPTPVNFNMRNER